MACQVLITKSYMHISTMASEEECIDSFSFLERSLPFVSFLRMLMQIFYRKEFLEKGHLRHHLGHLRHHSVKHGRRCLQSQVFEKIAGLTSADFSGAYFVFCTFGIPRNRGIFFISFRLGASDIEH